MASTATVAAIGLTCKTLLNSGLCSITATNLSVLLDALESEERTKNRGLVTVSNHISVLDDPVTWGILPAKYYFKSRTTRWSLGASDICFTNPVFSAFFRNGQVLETFRGKGIFQPAVDAAIQKLNAGGWVHLFGEGKIQMGGRIIMESANPPLIIPMWLTGFDMLMPENREFPYKYWPKLGVRLSVTFGEPLCAAEIRAALYPIRTNHLGNESLSTRSVQHRGLGNELNLGGWTGDIDHEMTLEKDLSARKMQMDDIRSNLTATIQRAVEKLGRKVSGDMLNSELS